MSKTEPTVYAPAATLPSVRRPLAALVAGAGVAAVYMGLAFLQVFTSVLYGWASGHFEDDLGTIAPISFQALGQDVPVVIVVLVVSFLFFWGLFPLHAGLRLGQAVGRGVVAAIVAGLVTGIVVSIQYLVIIRNLSSGEGGVLGAGSILRSLAEAADNSVTYFVQTAPFILLGAVILWNWTRSHPLTPTSQVVDPDAPVRV